MHLSRRAKFRLGIYSLAAALLLALIPALTPDPGVARAQQWGVVDEQSTHGVDREVQRRLDDLGHAEWQVRDRAGRWLIENRHAWIEKIPADWKPADPEAEWRWQQVLGTVRQLLALPSELQEDASMRSAGSS